MICNQLLYCRSRTNVEKEEGNMLESVIMKEPRKMCLREEQGEENLRKDIIDLLKSKCISLSQARALFDDIIKQIEDSPIN